MSSEPKPMSPALKNLQDMIIEQILDELEAEQTKQEQNPKPEEDAK